MAYYYDSLGRTLDAAVVERRAVAWYRRHNDLPATPDSQTLVDETPLAGLHLLCLGAARGRQSVSSYLDRWQVLLGLFARVDLSPMQAGATPGLQGMRWMPELLAHLMVNLDLASIGTVARPRTANA